MRHALVAAVGMLTWASPQAISHPPEDQSIAFEMLPIESSAPEALIEQADRAARLNLVDEADRLYRQVLLDDHQNLAAWRKLHALWEHRRLPVESEALVAARELLPTFAELPTRHFVILSDAPSHVVQDHATKLERARHEFLRYTRRLDLRPLPQRHRLVCILFDNRATYTDFARQHDNVAADWIAGYYSPRNDRVVFYNAQSNPSVLKARDDLSALESNVEDARARARSATRQGATPQARQMHREIEQYRQHINDQRLEIEAFATSFATATTVHETIHQLLFHMQVQSPYVEYPLWISEGLATAFETDSIDVSFGPDFDFNLRRSVFESILREQRIIPLNELIGIVRAPTDDRDGVDVLYHQSYALVTWLHHNRRNDLAQYLRLMRSHEPGRLTSAQHRTVFEQAFGDIDRLERAWLHDERKSIE